MNKIAIVRIRSSINVKRKIVDTLNKLKLYNQHTCVIVNNTKPILGMIKKVKDYVTWGEINKETLQNLLIARGKLAAKKTLTEEYVKEKTKLNFEQLVNEIELDKKSLKDVPGLKQFFKLKAPEGGFERGGIKKPYSMGGVLGYRKENINKLIQKML